MITTIVNVVLFALCLLLVSFVLIQQGKGDMGLGSLSRGTQAVFGGSGGANFFETSTWTMGAFFMGLALLLGFLYMKELDTSRIVPGEKEVRTLPVQKDSSVPSNKKAE